MEKDERQLVRISARHFVCGIDLVAGRMRNPARIIGYMNGWTEQRARDYCASKGWQWEIVPPLSSER